MSLLWAWIIGQLINLALYETGITDLGTLLILFLVYTNTLVILDFVIDIRSVNNQERGHRNAQVL